MNFKECEIVLAEASKRGLINPSPDDDICLKEYVNKANQILFQIEQRIDNTRGIVEALGLNANTVRCYTRLLERLGYIKRPNQGGSKGAKWLLVEQARSYDPSQPYWRV